jgi:DNA-3-methyladenine glycosylase II
MTKPKYWEEGKKYLSKKDKILKELIKKYPGHLKSRKDPFFSLCKSIVGQQISVQAANSVWKKLEAKSNKIKPDNILKLSKIQLANCGLSKQKITYLKILSKKFKTKEVDIQKLKKMDDYDAILHLTEVKGIGKWTAEMFLFFNQLRPDIFPVQDIGLLRAISKNYKTSYPPSNLQLKKFNKKWSPYCTVATWYLWRSIDPVVVSY